MWFWDVSEKADRSHMDTWSDRRVSECSWCLMSTGEKCANRGKLAEGSGSGSGSGTPAPRFWDVEATIFNRTPDWHWGFCISDVEILNGSTVLSVGSQTLMGISSSDVVLNIFVMSNPNIWVIKKKKKTLTCATLTNPFYQWRHRQNNTVIEP